MNREFARLLVRLYPRPWRERYGAEFETLLESAPDNFRTVSNIACSALREHIAPTVPNGTQLPSRLQAWSTRVPWVVFGLGPLFLLAGAYFVACSILWSGWQIFLPASSTPFVRVHGLAAFYFALGRSLYFAAPILIGWTIGVVAARQRIKALWPVLGLASIALTSASALVHAIPAVSGVAAQSLAVDHTFQGAASALLRALMIFSFLLLPYLLVRLTRTKALPV